jgi:hypothetical protein
MTTHRYCDGLTRRDVLRAGALGIGGLSLGSYLRLAHAGAVKAAPAQSAIFVWLGGGPPHMDTFDLKPDSPAEVRGEFNPIKTNVSGIEICEHLPKLAGCADKYALLRGVSHTLAGHELGTEYLNAGSRPLPSLVYPGYGAVVSKEKPGAADLPHFVAIPSTPQKAGYLGVQHAPLATTTVPQAGVPFSVRGISLENGLTIGEFESRQKLLKRLDTAFDEIKGQNSLVDGVDRFDQQAYSVISSPRAREAFDTSREPAAVSEQFGTHKFGQSCLLATRLIEAGVRFATVSFGGWDTHTGNFKKCKEELLPQLDQGLAAMLAALDQRGLLASTAVFVTGEFGRTPKINPKAGRDHWPRAFSVLMAGGGVKGGQVLGASDEKGMGPAGEPITPDQVAATFYHSLGIDYRREYHTNTGRPVMLVRDGSLIEGLLG